MMAAGLVTGRQDNLYQSGDSLKIEGEDVAKEVGETKSVEKRSPHYYSHHYHHGYHHGFRLGFHYAG